MLGKGLESLIPPDGNPAAVHENGSGAGDFGAGQAPPDLNTVGPIVDNAPPPNIQPQKEPLISKQSTVAPAPQVKKPVRRPDEGEAIFHIEVEKIRPNPQQPRRYFDEERIRELAASIREFGILQPIVVSKIEKEVPSGTDVEYQLIAGERRWLASKMLGLERIPAIVRNIDLERERLELAIIENVQREDLSPIERARAFARLQDEFHLTQREIGSRLGKSREAVANTVRLLDLPAFIQEALEKNQISESHGRLLLSINDLANQERLFHELLEKKSTTRDLKNRVRQLNTVPETETEKQEVPPELKLVQEKLSAELGAPVSIETHGDQGRITIKFYSPEELQNIVNKLGGEEL